MDYAFNEGAFTLPDAANDRTVNMILLNVGPGGPSLVISRDRLEVEESVEQFIDRQLTAASRQVKDLVEKSRRAITVGAAQLPATQIELTLKQNGATYHQVQTIFRVGGDRMIAVTVTCSMPLNDEQQALVQQMFDSFVPRDAAQV
jgi:hypothetical protein